jgi:hypothetical protein
MTIEGTDKNYGIKEGKRYTSNMASDNGYCSAREACNGLLSSQQDTLLRMPVVLQNTDFKVR